MNIVHTESSHGWGGQERRIVREMELLHAAGHHAYLIAPENSQVFKKASEKRLPVLSARFERRAFVGEALRLKSIFQKLRPDIVATHSSRDGWIAGLAAKLAGVPLIAKYRHVSVPVRKHPLNRWNYTALHRLVVGTSAEIISRLEGQFRFSDGRLAVIPTGVDLERFHPDTEPFNLRAELGLPGSAILLGVISVLRSWKGHEHLIRAVQELESAHPNLYLVIVGEGGQRRNLEDLILDLRLEQRIFLLGERENVPGILRSLDALVLPSVQKEGIPQIVLQAFATRTPVVSTNIGGIREVLSEQRGWLVEPGSSGALAAAIRQLLQQPEEAARRAAAALAYVRSEHSEQRMLERTLQAYRRLANGAG
jgi:glycosyltransferase involved in cell wall biosynthesis